MNIVEKITPLVPFLGAALGPRTEVVLHNLNSKEKSVVAIANGHISGRSVGSPVTDLVLRTIKRGDQEGTDALTGYRGTGADGRTLRSSSFFLRDDNSAIVGILCLNTDITALERAHEALTDELAALGVLGALTPTQPHPLPSQENFAGSVEDLRTALLDAALETTTTPPERLTPRERQKLVAVLDEGGLFLLKGGVAAAAERLGISEPSVYRYLTKIRGE